MFAELLQAIARRAIASFLSLIATSYLAHQLAREELGTYIGMLSLGQLLGGVMLLSLEVTPVYLTRTHPAHGRRIWGYSTLFSLALGAACLLLASAAQDLAWIGMAESRLQQWGPAPFVYAASFLLLQPQLACLLGLLKLGSYNVLQVVCPLTFLLSVLVLDQFGDRLNPLNALYAWSAVNLGCAVLAFVLVARAQPPGREESPGLDRNAFHDAFLTYATGSYSANLVGQLNARLPGILAAILLPALAAGHFAGVLILNDVFSFFSFAIASISLPILAGRLDAQPRTADLARACRLNFSATLVAAVAFMILFEPLTTLLLGKDFANRAFMGLCAVTLICTLLHSTARILCTDFAAQGRPLLSGALNVPSILVFIALFWMLGERFAEWGAVAAVSVASLCFSTLTFLVHRAKSGVRLRDITFLKPHDIKHICNLARFARPIKP